MKLKLEIIPVNLLKPYCLAVNKALEHSGNKGLRALFNKLKDAEISTRTFSFYTSVSSVFSSKIEGEEIELDSYIKHKKFGIKFLPDYTKKTDDLYNAYTFAQTHELNKKNTENAHELLNKHLVARHQQGKIRAHNMYVSTPDGKIEYVAATPQQVENEMRKLYSDMDVLMAAQLTLREVFFFAGFIHLIFVKIHPFNDGNGRTGRLLEKWFLARKLGNKAWFIQSKKNYYMQHQTYYKNLRALGMEYPELDYDKALPFLLMLPNALTMK